jgi:hypothetical protein
VPSPRMHLVHYFGVVAPNAKLRKFVVPEPPPEGEDDPCGHSVAYTETRNGRTIRRRWVPWATLLLRVFAIDVLSCPKCDGRMQRIAWTNRPQRSAGRLGRNRAAIAARRARGGAPSQHGTEGHQGHPRLR